MANNLYEKLKDIMRTPREIVRTDDEVTYLGSQVEKDELIKFIKNVKDIQGNRLEKLQDYDLMSKDSIIGSALELMADDSTQLDANMNMSYWVEPVSKNKKHQKVADDLNKWLREDFKINSRSWTIAYNVAKNGEMYLRTHENSEDASSDLLVVGEYLEDIINPSTVSHLELYGKTIGYQMIERNGEKATIYKPNEFIHIMIDKGDYDVVKAKTKRTKGGASEEVEREVHVKYGASLIENARQAWRILDLIENILLGVRLNGSPLYRMFSVEVGNAGRVETRKIINEIKQSITSEDRISKERLDRVSSPIPIGSNIYLPKRNGKGEIQVETVGGDVDIKEIADLEYFKDRLFAALKIPKLYLGFDSGFPGGWASGEVMTKSDIRYAHTILRLKETVRLGIQDIINWKLEKMGEDPGILEVFTTSVPTSESSYKREETVSAIQLADALATLVTTHFDGMIDVDKLLEYIMVEVLEISESNKLMTSKEEE